MSTSSIWRRILFSTGNEGKFEEAKHALSELIPGCEVLRANVDPAEIQGSCEDIAAEKTLSALRLAREQGVDLVGVDVFVTEDVRCALLPLLANHGCPAR